ncbi:MAG: hypothetical protein DMF20_06325 [Verrucomicrobia bacterium]|nr:MAG: hypothetical protein DMF20_06325 [Verrucomicrobiota bacterium]
MVVPCAGIVTAHSKPTAIAKAVACLILPVHITSLWPREEQKSHNRPQRHLQRIAGNIPNAGLIGAVHPKSRSINHLGS